MGSSMTYLLNFRVHAVVRKIESRFIQYTALKHDVKYPNINDIYEYIKLIKKQSYSTTH
jgi:hypothetical protein